jgi:GntR family transcriptional regulator
MRTEAVARDRRPIYIQVAETLRARILSGYYKDKLDGELKLTQEWSVSRRTIQQAIEILVDEGLIARQQGAGTFIKPQGVAKNFRPITSITDSIRAQGVEVSYRVLDSGRRRATKAAAAFFRLGAGAWVYRHARLVMGGGRPVAVASTLLNAELLEGIDLAKLDKGLYDTLRHRFGRTIVHAEDSYRPAVPDAKTKQLLGLADDVAIYIAERKAYDQSGEPLELSTISVAPVRLEISIAQAGADWPGKPPEGASPWEFRVGFGEFQFGRGGR